MPKTVADYEEAVSRIVRANVPDDATTEADVRAALAANGSVQVSAEDSNGRTVADNIADKIVTVERVREAIDATGEIPTAGEIDAIADVADDYDLDDRVAEVADQVSREVATIEDVEQAVRERQDQKGTRPTFREDVEGAVDEVAQDKDFLGESPGEVADRQAYDIGAPREDNFRREAATTIASSEQVTPSEVVEGTGAQTSVQVIEDASGEVVAATGGPSDDIGQQVADEVGAEYLSTEQVVDEMSTAGTGDRVDLTLRGQKIGEVDV
jgi:hypothetical protein